MQTGLLQYVCGYLKEVGLRQLLLLACVLLRVREARRHVRAATPLHLSRARANLLS